MRGIFRWIVGMALVVVGVVALEAQGASTVFLNFEGGSVSPNVGSSYVNQGVTFTAGGSTAAVGFEGVSPPIDFDPGLIVLFDGYDFFNGYNEPSGYFGHPIAPAPGRYLVGLDAMSFSTPVRAAAFKVLADGPGEIVISADGQELARVAASQAGWCGPVLVAGDDAIGEISFSGEVFVGLDNLLMYKDWLPGDATGDGSVDVSDFSVLKSNYGDIVEQLPPFGDMDHDGDVDLDDFIIAKQGVTDGWLLIRACDFNADNRVDFKDFIILKRFYNQSID